jgi:hypothetical protein
MDAKHFLTLVAGTLPAVFAYAQNIGINTTGAAPATSAMLDIDAANRGLLLPRVALTATNAAGPIAAPANALLVYNTATAGTAPNNVTPGYYYWETATSTWLPILSGVKGWTTTGNTGTVPGTNFLGTLDAADLVIKTSGSAAANERMRLLSGGQVVVNKATAAAGDAFSAYANGTGNISNTGDVAISGYSNIGFGMYGEAANVNGMGVVSVNTATTGNSISQWSETASPNGKATVSIANTSNAAVPNGTNAIGVQGQVNGTLPGTGQAIGVLGITPSTMTTGDANGVWGQTSSSSGTGVFGIANSSTSGGQPIGVYGLVANATGAGMEGVNQHASGTGAVLVGNNAGGLYLTNGSGAAFTGTGVGGFGYATTSTGGNGLVGVGNNLSKIYTPARGAGVTGTGKQYGVIGFATNVTNTNPTNNNASAGANGASGGYFEVQNAGGTAQTWAYVGVRDNTSALRKIIGPGTVNTIVKDLHGELVALSAPEAPENLFQDYGEGKLVQGRGHVELDPILARNIVVNEAHPLRVFIQLEGDCKGVYVANKTGTGFDVMELDGGRSDVPFTWCVVANRADEVLPDGTVSRYSAERFPVAPGPVEKEKQELGQSAKPAKSPVREAPLGTRTKTRR